MNNTKSPIIHLYPDNFEIDLLYKTKYWQGIAILPDLEIGNIKNVLSQHANYNDEKNRLKDVLIFETI